MIEQKDLSRSQVSALIDEWIFSRRDREILKMRLLDGMTYADISDECGLSIRQVKNIVYKSEDRLFRHI